MATRANTEISANCKGPMDLLLSFSPGTAFLFHERWSQLPPVPSLTPDAFHSTAVQVGRTRAYVIKTWRQSEIQQVKEAKAPPPRSPGKLGDTVDGQCSAVR
jgi:hypothetical protein